ncbi:MAG: hypothetical protein ACI35S_06805 [Anaeroplasma sp.]
MAQDLKIYEYVDGTNDLPFPNQQGDEQVSLTTYSYEAQRMSPTSKISATFSYYRCLDKDWENKDIYVIYNEEKYFVRTIPSSKKNNKSLMYEHEVVFYSERFILENVYLYDVDKSDKTKITLRCNLIEFADLINNSLTKSSLDYKVVVNPNIDNITEVKDVELEDVYIAEALQQIYELWDVPYYYEGKNIIVSDYSDYLDDVVLEYGYDKSLLSINKTNANFRKITRCSGYGSDRNIPEYYPNNSQKGIIDVSPLSTNTLLTKSMLSIVDMKKFDKNMPLNNEVKYSVKYPINIDYSRWSGSISENLSLLNQTSDWFKKDIYFESPYSGVYIDINFDLSITEHFSIGSISLEDSVTTPNWYYTPEEIASYIMAEYHFKDSRVYSLPGRNNYVLSTNVNSESETINYVKKWFIIGTQGYNPSGYVFDTERNINITLTCFIINDSNEDVLSYVFKLIFRLLLNKNISNNLQLGDAVKYNWFGIGKKKPVYAELQQRYNCDVEISNLNMVYSATSNVSDGWYMNGRSVNLDDLGISINGTPNSSWDGEGFYQELVDKIPISEYLMPPIYRNTWGKEKFYNALNNTHLNEDGSFYTFDTLWSIVNQNEHIQQFEDIYPSIKDITNTNGELFGSILEVAFDDNDNNDVDEEGNYLHPYFYIRIPIFDGTNGFNLFNHKIFGDNMKVAMTSGDCSACNFDIMVKTKENINNPTYEDVINPIMTVSETDNTLVSGDYNDKTNGDFNNFIVSQQDSQLNSIWLILKKDAETFTDTFPDSVRGIVPKIGDTFVLYNIEMPEQYIYDAEEKLRIQILNYMQENNSDKWNFDIDFSRIYLKENEQYANRLNENVLIDFMYDNVKYSYYVNSFKKEYNNKELLPKITISIVSELGKEYAGITQQITNNVLKEVNPYIAGLSEEFNNTFLRKFQDETMPNNMTFKKDVDIEGSINSDKNISNTIESKNYEENLKGFGIKEIDGEYTLDIDNVVVRNTLKSKELIIKQITSQNGILIISPANMECINVEEDVDNGYYKCYFDTKDGSVINQFKVNDLARCQRIGFSTKYYWRKVVEVGEDYICLSISDCDANSDIPTANDIIVQLGNSTDTDRQSAIVISTVDFNSPSFIAYSGIDSYSLSNKDITGIVYHQDYIDENGNNVQGYPEIYSYGAMYFGNRTKEDNYIQFQKNEDGDFEMLINAKTIFKGEYVSFEDLFKQLSQNSNATTNLIKNGLVNNFDNSITFTTISNLEPETEYLFSIERTIINDGSATNIEVFIESYTDGVLLYSGNIEISEDTPKYINFSTPTDFNDLVDITLNIENSNATILGVKLAKGITYIGWNATQEEQDSLILLNNAIKSYTEIIGGLVLTNVIGMKNEDGDIKAGISGLGAKNGLRFWASQSWEKAEQSLFRVYDDGSLFATRAYTFLPAFEINDDNISNYVTSSNILYLDQSSNTTKSYSYSFFNFDLTGSKILINTDKYNISRINMPVNKEYYGATIEIYNPNNKELNFSTNVPDIEYCNTQNYLDRMVTQGYIGAYNSFNNDYYNYPSGILSINRGSMYGRVAVLKSVVNAYRFTIRKRIITPITDYTYLRFRMLRIKLNDDISNYLGRYYSINEDGYVYLWVCEEKQKEPQLFVTNTPSVNNKFIGGFE